MEPLARTALDYRLAGRLGVATGVVLAAASALHRPVVEVAALWVLGALLGAPVMYVLVYRRLLHRDLGRAGPAPADAPQEGAPARRRRIVAPIMLFMLVLGAATLLLRFDAGAIAGLATGQGAAAIAAALWLERWERRHDALVLSRAGGWRRSTVVARGPAQRPFEP